jgi:biotin carboxyl carrier protein
MRENATMAVSREQLTSLMERFEELGLTQLVLDVGGTHVELTSDGRPAVTRDFALHHVLAPSVGIARPASERGSRVRAGDVVCTLDVWTSSLPVLAGVDGVVEAVHVADGTLVEYGQALLDVGHG